MRKGEVTFSISEIKTEDDKQRAQRLAFFVSTISERPERFKTLTNEQKTINAWRVLASTTEVQAYAEELDNRDGHLFDTRATYATAAILEHGDDLEADPDKETAIKMRHGLQLREVKKRSAEYGRGEAPEMDWRIERLGILAAEMSDIRPDFNGNDHIVGAGGVIQQQTRVA